MLQLLPCGTQSSLRCLVLGRYLALLVHELPLSCINGILKLTVLIIAGIQVLAALFQLLSLISKGRISFLSLLGASI